MDLLPYLPFDIEKVKREMKTVNPDALILELSAASLDGLDSWIELLLERKAAKG